MQICPIDNFHDLDIIGISHREDLHVGVTSLFVVHAICWIHSNHVFVACVGVFVFHDLSFGDFSVLYVHCVFHYFANLVGGEVNIDEVVVIV